MVKMVKEGLSLSKYTDANHQDLRHLTAAKSCALATSQSETKAYKCSAVKWLSETFVI